MSIAGPTDVHTDVHTDVTCSSCARMRGLEKIYSTCG